MSTTTSKATSVRAHMAAGEWAEAIRLAASFPRLYRHRTAILDARSAYTNPRFLQQIGRDGDSVRAHSAPIESFGLHSRVRPVHPLNCKQTWQFRRGGPSKATNK